MNLVIDLDGNNIKLSLVKDGKIINEHSWIGEHSLSEKLLVEIDTLLTKSKVKKEDVEKIVPKISATSGVTSSRIVETVAKAWKAAR